MNIDKATLINLLKEISDQGEIKPTDIPCVDLYMDQVTTLFDDKLKASKRYETDKILTKTMINNYTKDKLLTPIKGKKYNKNQIILLVLIYNLKQTLSINDIGQLLSPLIDTLDENNKSENLDSIYSAFLNLQKKDVEIFMEDSLKKFESIEDELSQFNSSNAELSKLLLTIFMLVDSANLQKRMAERLIDNYFSPKDK
ncbi:DUF1836 domain-containing protein [Clostridium omnivorum]|uniref:DUF1836 domain-containing protein n=1 Tax=Clostridium omnivorum TaxID=1604902 RepID=A0ABQ5N9Y7_9CLOT|nr:DUF1836 domain-containing protein [Clostridium sp. E14]GLC32073.1 hypothetical protein bsdE14_34830 [Clostridium sp. E14]